MDILARAINKIITEQENIIGPLAVEQAKKISGLKINWEAHEISIEGDKKIILENLVKRYENIFGQASIEVCREAVHSMLSSIPPDLVPNILH